MSIAWIVLLLLAGFAIGAATSLFFLTKYAAITIEKTLDRGFDEMKRRAKVPAA